MNSAQIYCNMYTVKSVTFINDFVIVHQILRPSFKIISRAHLREICKKEIIEHTADKAIL